MAAYKFVYHMDKLSKTYPGAAKPVFDGISLHFLPDAKIGVVGVNCAGKSTLLKIMAGMDTEFTGEAWAEKGVKVGYLAQEPQLDEDKTVWENVIPIPNCITTASRPLRSCRSKAQRTSRSSLPA